MDLSGRNLGNYEGLERLGKGAMGAVYKARDRKLGREVALKILPPTLSEEKVARFEREARAISALNHPNIATIYAFEQAEGRRFLVFEYVGGGTLRERIEKIKATAEPLPPRRLAEDALQIARGLAHAHRRGVVHRDIKSENVLVTEDGVLKVSDFGLAKLELESSLTEEGSVLGTMAYMAPEQIMGEKSDARADIFSFGVLCHEMTVAELPFQAVHMAALQYEILNTDPPPLAELRGNLPDAWVVLVSSCLAKRPEDRPQTMDAVVSALETLRDDLVSGPADRSVTGPLTVRKLEIGQTLGRYRLLSKIGEGGMGAVYRARDLTLDRQVALKTLKAEAVEDSDRKRRFVQEAKAASALNHPNIVTIHEIDERDGISYIAMEFVEGETLDRKLAAGGLPLQEALETSIAVAGALTAAHNHGIVHRDLKPANVMHGEDGRVKLLDFGLAKLAAPDAALETDSHSSPRTEEGVILGTVAYMSPEQAEGRPVDPRSDVFSFGSMLYEMVSGKRAFAGESKVSVLASILQKQPAPLRRHAPRAPLELERIILRCLNKAPERRYQHMGDLKLSLEELLEDYEAGRLDPPAPPKPAAPRSKASWPSLLAAALAGALFAAIVLQTFRRGRSGAIHDNREAALMQLTGGEGLSIDPTWSPNGDWLAYASDAGGGMDLWKQPSAGGEPVQLTNTPLTEMHPAWSPDGRTLAYTVQGEGGGIFLIPSGGGQSIRVTDFGARPSWAPDGRELAFDANGSIYIVNYAGGEPLRIVEGASGTPFVEWSRDGESLYYWDRTRRDLFLVDIESREATALDLIPTGEEVTGIAVGPQGDRMVFAKGAFGGDKDLWRVSLDPLTGMPLGDGRRLTISATDDIQPSYSADGSRLAFTVRNLNRQLWSVGRSPETGLATRDAQVATEHGELNYYPAASADGLLIAWTSQNAGQGAIHYKLGLAAPEHKLTREWDRATREIGAAVSPDGNQIAFSSTSTGAYRLWRMPALDSVALQLTDGRDNGSDAQPAWSPDGKTLAFYSNRSGNWDIWTVDSAAGGQPRPLLEWPSNELYPVYSPDGRSLAFVSSKDGDDDIYLLDLATGEAAPFVEHPATEGPCTWSPDGKWFYFTSDRDGAFAVWRMPADGGEPERFNPGALNLPEAALFTKFAVTNDALILPVETRRGDVHILENLE